MSLIPFIKKRPQPSRAKTVVGPDLTLEIGAEGELSLSTCDGRPLGVYASAREAWELVDRIDTGEAVVADILRAAA